MKNKFKNVYFIQTAEEAFNICFKENLKGVNTKKELFTTNSSQTTRSFPLNNLL